MATGPAYLDFDSIVHLGNNPLALRGLSRTMMRAGNLNGTTIGVDVRAFKAEAIAGRIVGVLFELPDAVSQASDAKPTGDRCRVSLVVNLPFGALRQIGH